MTLTSSSCGLFAEWIQLFFGKSDFRGMGPCACDGAVQHASSPDGALPLPIQFLWLKGEDWFCVVILKDGIVMSRATESASPGGGFDSRGHGEHRRPDCRLIGASLQ